MLDRSKRKARNQLLKVEMEDCGEQGDKERIIPQNRGRKRQMAINA